jgi:hypothetical protein
MSLFEVMKPYLWLAAIAFFVGFISYVTLGAQSATPAFQDETSWQAQVSAPTSDEWNVPKRI